MSKIVKHGDRYYFKCPGCEKTHVFNNTWQFNNDLEKPTVSPSILVNGDYSCPSVPRCHSYVTDGKIQFLDDCSHDMKGQIVDLPDYSGDDIV